MTNSEAVLSYVESRGYLLLRRSELLSKLLGRIGFIICAQNKHV